MISDLKFAAYYLPVFCFVNFSLEFFHRHIFIAGRLISYRMESRYDFFYHLNDVRTPNIVISCMLMVQEPNRAWPICIGKKQEISPFGRKLS